MACIASVLLSRSPWTGVLRLRVFLLSLRSRDPATVCSRCSHEVTWTCVEEGARNLIVLQRQHCRWCQRVGESHTELFHIFIEIKKGESVSPRGLLSPSGVSHFGDATLMWQGPHQVSKTPRSVHTTLLSRLSRCSGVRRARSLCSCLWRSAACHAGCSFYCSWAALAGWSTSTKWEVDRRAPSCEWWRSLGGHCPGCLQCPGKTRGCQFIA